MEVPASLVSRIAGGDCAAFSTLYDVIAPIANGMLRRRGLGERASAVVLESLFLRIWREAPCASRSASSDSAWVVAQIDASLRDLRFGA